MGAIQIAVDLPKKSIFLDLLRRFLIGCE